MIAVVRVVERIFFLTFLGVILKFGWSFLRPSAGAVVAAWFGVGVVAGLIVSWRLKRGWVVACLLLGSAAVLVPHLLFGLIDSSPLLSASIGWAAGGVLKAVLFPTTPKEGSFKTRREALIASIQRLLSCGIGIVVSVMLLLHVRFNPACLLVAVSAAALGPIVIPVFLRSK